MFGKTTEYALRALVYIYIQNQDGKKPGFKEIALNIESPVEFTAKVLQKLSRSGMISSSRGRGGGFFFEQDSGKLSLFQLINSIDSEFDISRCGFGLSHCSDSNPCPLHSDYVPIRDHILKMLKTQTISILAGKVQRKEAVIGRNIFG